MIWIAGKYVELSMYQNKTLKSPQFQKVFPFDVINFNHFNLQDCYFSYKKT